MALVARVLSVVTPRLALPNSLDAEGLSTDPTVVEAYVADPLVHSRMTAALAVAFLGAARRTAPEGGRVGVPLIVQHGLDDPLCLPAAAEAFARAAPDGTWHGYPGLKHEIFNEPSHEEVFGDLLAWLAPRIPAGPGAP